MAGIAEGDVHARQDRLSLVVCKRPYLCHRRLHVLASVQRLDLGLAVAAAPVGAFGVRFGQRGRVHQHHRHQFGGGRLRMDRPAESAPHQQRNPADVIDVGMAYHQRVQRRRFERERIGIAGLGLAAALEHPAVQQDPPAARVQQMHRAGHLAGRAMEFDPHSRLSQCPPNPSMTGHRGHDAPAMAGPVP